MHATCRQASDSLHIHRWSFDLLCMNKHDNTCASAFRRSEMVPSEALRHHKIQLHGECLFCALCQSFCSVMDLRFRHLLSHFLEEHTSSSSTVLFPVRIFEAPNDHCIHCCNVEHIEKYHHWPAVCLSLAAVHRHQLVQSVNTTF